MDKLKHLGYDGTTSGPAETSPLHPQSKKQRP